jgi:trk system potassium uptake protein TrkH
VTEQDSQAIILRRIDWGMAVSALTALVALVVEYGFTPTGLMRDGIRVLDLICVFLFGGLQAAKLLVVKEPGKYFKTHRVDFSLLFVLAVQTIVYLALRNTPEYFYLEQHGLPSPLWAFYIALLQGYLITIVALRSPWVHRLLIRLRLRPTQIMVTSFLILIAGGTLLLAIPGATTAEGGLPLLDAIFTATSAVCVTGLVVRDTGVEFTTMGQAVILVLIQLGGLGMITITGFFALFSGSRLSRGETETLGHALEADSVQRMRKVLKRILLATIFLEGAGALLLMWAWESTIPDPLNRAGWALFHAVSAFCNAGFSLFAENGSLSGFVTDGSVLAVVGVLVILGGLGFGVLNDLLRTLASKIGRGKTRGLSRQSRWVLASTAMLLLAGTAIFFVLERNGAMQSLATGDAWMNAAFQSLTLRTAGFSTLDLSNQGAGTIFFSSIWMLIGGSPGGTAGGMKTVTIAVLLVGIAGKGLVAPENRSKALRIILLFGGLYAAASALLFMTQGALGESGLFEIASALGTVGLSMGYTEELDGLGKILVSVLMFAGRVGPFALAAAVWKGHTPAEPADRGMELTIG